RAPLRRADRRADRGRRHAGRRAHAARAGALDRGEDPMTGTAAAAAAGAFRALAGVLAAGAEASGAFAQAELLRSIHACRSEGLHRLAAAQTRALRSIRELRSDKPEFSLYTLTGDLREGLTVAHTLTSSEPT